MIAPAYPRIPYLWAPSDRAADDRTVDPAEAAAWLTRHVVVEEKLDGANVSIWLDGGQLEVASRGGVGSMDRAHQLGRLRAWCSYNDVALRQLLGTGLVLYGEWLWLQHSVPYTRLPDWLIVLDLWSPDTGFHSEDDRDEAVSSMGLTTPPKLFEGVLESESRVRALCGRSIFADGVAAEGLVFRAGQDRCKVVADTFVRSSDEMFALREHNRLG